MPQKIELSKNRKLSEIIDDSLTFFKQNWKPLIKAYFSICGFFWAAALIVSLAAQLYNYQIDDPDVSNFGFSFWGMLLFEILNFTVIAITALSFIALYKEKGNEAPNTAEVWSYVKFYFFRILFSNVLLIASLALGFICCFFPGIYLWPVFSLVLTIMVMENSSLGYAFNYSFKLISNSWGQVFSILVVSLLLVGAALLLFTIPIGIITGIIVFISGKNENHIYAIAANIAFHLIQFVYLFPFISLVLVYYNLTELKEDNSLLKRIEMVGKYPIQDNLPTTEEEY
jgi:hypothetical protein